MMDKYIDSKGLKTYTSLIKEQIDKSQKAILDTKAQANGIATLDSKGHVPLTQLGNVDNTLYELSSSLPTNLADTETLKNRINHIFIIPKDTETTQNAYKEYIYTGTLDKDGNVEDASKWEELGEFTSAIDLQDYCKKSEVAATYLPLAGGSMNEGAMINMDKGTINLNADESNYIIHSSTSSEYVKEVGADASKSVIIAPTAITVLNQDEAKHSATTIAYDKITVGENVTLTEGQLRLYDGDKRVLHTTSDSMYSGTSGNVAVSSDAIKLTAEDGSNTQHNAGNSAYSKTEEDTTYSTNVNNRGVFIVDGADNVVQHTSTYSQYYSNDDTSSHTQIDKGGLNIANAGSDSTTEVTLEGVSVGNESAKLTKDKLTVGNASLTTDTLFIPGGANCSSYLTALKLSLGASVDTDRAFMDPDNISLSYGTATLNVNQLTINGGQTKLDSNGVKFANSSSFYNNTLSFVDGVTKMSYSGIDLVNSATIRWMQNGTANTTLHNYYGFHIVQKGYDTNTTELHLEYNDGMASNCCTIRINSIIHTESGILDMVGNNIRNSIKGLYLYSSYTKEDKTTATIDDAAFSTNGISIRGTMEGGANQYKNAILRNMPADEKGITHPDTWGDKIVYTIGPKDTSFTTEYEAVAPLVQDPDDSSKWTIPSEYLPDSSGGSSDSVDLIIPSCIWTVPFQTEDLYFDNVSSEYDGYDCYPLVVSDSASKTSLLKLEKDHYRFTAPLDASTKLTVKKLDNTSEHNVILNKEVTITSTDAASVSVASMVFCIMGDGFISETYVMAEIMKHYNEETLVSSTFIGTQKTTLDGVEYVHEGRKDWDWTHYLDPSYGSKTYSGSTNAFVADGELNFQKYLSTNFSELSTIDVFVICMGTKEVMYGASDDIVASVVENTKTFIDTLISSDKGFPTCRVVISLPPVGPYNSNNTGIDTVTYKASINKLNKALIEAFDNHAYSPNVWVAAPNLFVNRYDGYDYKEIAVDDYSTRTIRQYKNLPYFSEVGGRQYGKGIFNAIIGVCEESL